jgi:hypothetical protein
MLPLLLQILLYLSQLAEPQTARGNIIRQERQAITMVLSGLPDGTMKNAMEMQTPEIIMETMMVKALHSQRFPLVSGTFVFHLLQKPCAVPDLTYLSH